MIKHTFILRNSCISILAFITLLWVIKWLEWQAHSDLGFLGILPRTLSGTMGIVTAPLIHGDWLHLISNTFPLIILGISLFYFYHKIAYEVFGWIYFMSGFWVWMAARDAYHIGASGLVYGLVTFLFFSGIFRRDLRSLTISLLVVFLYGGMIQGIFPGNEQISWESHFLGSLAGLFCAFFYKNEKVFVSSEGDNEVDISPHPTYQEMQNLVDLYAIKPQDSLKYRSVAVDQKPAYMAIEHTSTSVQISYLTTKSSQVTHTGPKINSPFSLPVFSQPTYRIQPMLATNVENNRKKEPPQKESYGDGNAAA